ncbi:hypothetical protein HDE_04053 [Halotydeus destructor]|nr:hypothetical protein HDE_04053 [Halotydeus destructor]
MAVVKTADAMVLRTDVGSLVLIYLCLAQFIKGLSIQSGYHVEDGTMCDDVDHIILSEATLFQDDFVDFALCGCHPDATTHLNGAGNESKALIFKDNYYVVYDRMLSDRKIISSLNLIRLTFPGIPDNLDAVFSYRNGYVFIKNTFYYIYEEQNRTIVRAGPISEWHQFPSAFAAFINTPNSGKQSKQPVSFQLVDNSGRLYNCSFSEAAFIVSCIIDESPFPVFDTISSVVGKLRIYMELRDGHTMIFGKKKFCIAPPNGMCYPSCHSVLFKCPSIDKLDFLVYSISWLGLMTSAGAVSIWFCVVTSRAIRKRGKTLL